MINTKKVLFRALVVLPIAGSWPLAAAAGDPAVTALTQPGSSFEFGADYVRHDSYKFGEYNGLEKQGAYAVGNLDLAGGGSYDSDSVARWDFHAHDVGLQTSDAQLRFREQGKFSFNLGYDQLLHNLSDSYQTPFLGAGTNTLTLPTGWLKPVVPQINGNLNYRSFDPFAGQGSVVNSAGVVVSPTAAQLATLGAIVATDAGAFHPYNLHTQRRRGEVGFSANLNPHLLLTGSLRHETQEGYRPLGADRSAVNENAVILPELVDTTTNQFALGLEYAGRKFFLKAGYYGSNFNNDVSGMTWSDPANATQHGTMSTPPSNQFSQFNFSAGYNFSRTLHLAADYSYGRARQNEAFLVDSTMPIGVPVTSAHAQAVTHMANLKLTDQLTRKLSLFARYKYDDRDDQTPIHTFVFYDAGILPGATASAFNAALGLAPGTLASNVNIFNNRPQSRRINEFSLGGDYLLAPQQHLAAGFDWQKIERSCDSWYNCASAPKTIDRTLHLDWRGQLKDTLSAQLGYSRAERSVHYDSNAWLALVPMANQIPGAPIVGATNSVYGYLMQNGLTGFGPLAGYPSTPLTGDAALFSPNNNIVPQSLYGSRDNVSEIPGMRRYNLADRNRDRIRAALEWQATDRLSFHDSFGYDRNDYLHSPFGLQKSSGWSLGLDGSYAINDRLQANAFYAHEETRQHQRGDGFASNSNVAFIGVAGNTLVDGSCYQTVQSRNNNAKLDPCLIWTADTRERADTGGISLARSGLWKGRLRVNGDVVLTRALTNVDVNGGAYANNPYALAGAPPLPPGVPAAILIPATNLPTVMARTLDLRLGGSYAIDSATELRVLYLYEHMRVTDFAYDGMQFGTVANQMPTLERAPTYDNSVIAFFYRHRF
jgi:MtrB/PioB family decaheme-associated outer membrane protein